MEIGDDHRFWVKPWIRTVRSGDLDAVGRVVAEGRARGGVPATAAVVSCYEAGREGFWIHRALTRGGIQNRVVDSSSIEVKRRARRTKTDRIDAGKLLMLLVRVCSGERGAWQEVRVPTEAAEAARHVSRERTALRKEQTRLGNQIGSWLATCGCGVSRRARRTAAWWTTARDWQGERLPAPVQARIARAEARLAVLTAQITTLEEAQRAATQTAAPESALGRLVQLKGVATTSATILLDEGLVWRAFRNRREVGGLQGFAPAIYSSGTTDRDQGISRAGNARLQAVSIQLAWNWVRWQPLSAITQWYRAHFGERRRARRIGIVAVPRKLLIALWRYATTGVVPAGALLHPVRVA
ncbi:MAG: IS110 family transposase [Acidobacteria bacterium]|nr:MAG: IS110 family transposase [Acidobacteriota bacterium]PYR50469.1 MAG: IS110 family transposase [Acidobacteriota bacterium]